MVEVLVSTAVASIALTGAVGLLAASARAVADSELETTAVWAASRTIEEWRTQATPALEGRYDLDRDGNPVAGVGVFQASWVARPASGSPGAWQVTATVSSGRLRQAIAAEALVRRVSP